MIMLGQTFLVILKQQNLGFLKIDKSPGHKNRVCESSGWNIHIKDSHIPWLENMNHIGTAKQWERHT